MQDEIEYVGCNSGSMWLIARRNQFFSDGGEGFRRLDCGREDGRWEGWICPWVGGYRGRHYGGDCGA